MPEQARVINVTQLIDERELSRPQMVTIFLCGLVALLDGMDTQSIGVAAPFIIKALALKPGQFGPVFSAALFGAMVGALAFGPVADRLGRKRLMVVATALFGIFTVLTALAHSYNSLMVYRFLAGFGLGGATPCFITMTSEYSPKRLRATLVGVMWACFPLGGMIGGFMNSWLILHLGWPSIFYVGGLLPLLVAAVLALWLPESLRFLMTQEGTAPRVERIVARMFPDAVAPGTRFTAQEEKLVGASIRHLFSEGRTLTTLVLWVPFFMGFGTLAVSVLWTPTLLNLAGIPPSTTAFLIGIYGIGALIGNSFAGKLLDRFGILPVPVPAFLLGALALIGVGYSAGSVFLAGIFLMLTSGMLGIGVTSSIVIASTAYPTAMRSTGVGWAMGAGRFGQVVLPLIAGFCLGLGWSALHIMMLIAVAPVLGAAFLLILRTRTEGAAPEAARLASGARG